MSLQKSFSNKQLYALSAYKYRRPRFLINHGAVRTGKTTIDNFIFLNELKKIQRYCCERGIRYPQYILGGASVKKIEENVLREIRNNYNLQINLNKHNEFELFNVIVCCTGTDDIGQFANIVGMTSFGAYLNEASVCKEEIFDEINKRCSGDYDPKTGVSFSPLIICDSNPDSPEHYLKKNYIDKSDGKTIISTHWELDDNPYLAPNIVEDLKKTTPSGVFYNRKIKGLWVTADGLVYRDFDKKVHVIEKLPPPKEFNRYYAGVDWGYAEGHKGVIILVGVHYSGVHYIIKVIAEEYKLIDWWVKQGQAIVKKYGRRTMFYCDSARPDNIQKFREGGLMVLEANKAVSAGIEAVATEMKNEELFFYSNGIEGTDFLKEMYSYAWNKNTGEPIKKLDDIMDALRYAEYTDGLITHKFKEG